jgi:Flp pilus assembly protein TadD
VRLDRHSPPATATGTTRWTLVLSVALAALVLRLAYVYQIAEAPFFHLRLGDADAYHRWALRIAAGDWLGAEIFYQAPLYPYFLAVVYRLLGDGATLVRFVQAIVGAGSCALLAAAGMALFGRRGAAAGALLAIYPPAIFVDGQLEKTTLVTFFTALLLLISCGRRTPGRAFLAGVTLGLLALTRENALLLAVPLVAWFTVHGHAAGGNRGAPRLARVAAACLGGCALVLLPIGARNYHVGGEFHLTTSQFGPNFYIGNHAGARGVYDPLIEGHGNASDERHDATRLAEQATGRTMTPDDVSWFWTARALDFIRNEPWAWTGQLARKLALTYNAGEVADTESQIVYAEYSPVLRALGPLNFGVILALAAAGACLTAHTWRQLWFLYAVVVTYTASVVVFYVFARYRFPLVPVLMLLASGALAGWSDPAARRRRGAAVAAAGVAAVVAYAPLVDAEIYRLAHYVNIANTLSSNPRAWDQAAAFYAKALEHSPRSPAAHFGIAALLTRMDKPEEAVLHYRAAVEGWPDNPDLRLNFAMALAALGDHEGALGHLETAATFRTADPAPHLLAGQLLLDRSLTGPAIEKFRLAAAVDPRSAVAHKSLGTVLAATGHVEEALREFERALQLDPRDEELKEVIAQARRSSPAPP